MSSSSVSTTVYPRPVVLHHLDLDAFSQTLLTYHDPDQPDQAKPEWQLLYYGVVAFEDPEKLLAILAHSPTGQQVWLMSPLDKPWPSLAHRWPALLWPEREVWDLTGKEPQGHPDLQPLRNPHLHRMQGRAKGGGVFSLPLGPVRADVNESGFLLFDTVGEQIVHLQVQLFYKHRGLEQMAISRSPDHVRLLAERVSGTSAASHAIAYCNAAEQAMGIEVPAAVLVERQLWVELERLYNHAHDLSQMASASGMTVAQAQLARIKEALLRLNADLTGSRYLHNAVQLGQTSGVDWGTATPAVLDQLKALERHMARVVQLLLRTPTFVDRLVGTGIVTREWALAYGVVGPTARACGIATDVRQDFPSLTEYTDYELYISPRAVGDALDRFDVRVKEWSVSLRMVRNLIHRLSRISPVNTRPFSGPNEGWGIGLVEGPRGRIAHVVQVNRGRIVFWGIRSASSWIWPVFGLATSNGNIQTDFPVIDSSFGLSYAGFDR